MYLLHLYWRNVRGIFVKGFTMWPENDFPIESFAHFLFLPVSLTFGAGVKTLIDFFSRKYVPRDTIEMKIKEINSMNSAQMHDFVPHLLKYKAKSNSSRMLLNQLNAANPRGALPLGQERSDKLIDQQKKCITDYMKSEKNNGKKLLQITLGIFSASDLGDLEGRLSSPESSLKNRF